MEKFEELYREYSDKATALLGASREYIETAIASLPDHCVQLDNVYSRPIIVYNDYYLEEYEVNPSAEVRKIFQTNDGSIMLELDEDPEYSVKLLTPEETYAVARAIKEVLHQK